MQLTTHLLRKWNVYRRNNLLVCFAVGDYEDIDAGLIGEDTAVQSIIDDSGHYQYIDIDRISDDVVESGAARSQGYEGLDQSTLGQPQRPHDYDRLGAANNTASTQQTAEAVEMNVLGDSQDYQDAVSCHRTPKAVQSTYGNNIVSS